MKKTAGQKKSKFFNTIIFLALLCFFCYAIITMISQQVAINNKKIENDQLSQKVEASQMLNDEFARLLSFTDEKTFMEKIATERLGYAYPNEKRYMDISKN